MGRGKTQDAVVELVAQAAQHALAHAALLRIDGLLELPVHDDGAQEDETHDDKVLKLVDLEAVEQAHDLARQDELQVEFPDQERDGLGVLEGVALDAVVDDVFRNRERQEVENLRQEHERQNDQLLGPAVPPNVSEQIALHRVPCGGALVPAPVPV